MWSPWYIIWLASNHVAWGARPVCSVVCVAHMQHVLCELFQQYETNSPHNAIYAWDISNYCVLHSSLLITSVVQVSRWSDCPWRFCFRVEVQIALADTMGLIFFTSTTSISISRLPLLVEIREWLQHLLHLDVSSVQLEVWVQTSTRPSLWVYFVWHHHKWDAT